MQSAVCHYGREPRLSAAKRSLILQMLVEGSSMRSISRVTGASLNTVIRLLEDAGNV